MKKWKKILIGLCVILIFGGGILIVLWQMHDNESSWEMFSDDHKDLVEKYPDWFDKNGDFYYGNYLKNVSETNSQTEFKEDIKLAQVPKELYQAMTTEQLLDAVESYPMIYTLGIYDSIKLAINSVSDYFGAMKELLKREDIAEKCCDRYVNRDFTNKVNKDGVANKEGQVYFEVGILLRESSYKKLDESQRSAVLKKFRENVKDYPSEQLGGSTKTVVQMEFDNLESEKSNSWAKKIIKAE